MTGRPVADLDPADIPDAAPPRVDAHGPDVPREGPHAPLHATSPIERLTGEIRRRIDVVGIFPDAASLRRLAGAVVMAQTEEGTVLYGRCMRLATLAPVCADTVVGLPAAQGDGLARPRRHPSRRP